MKCPKCGGDQTWHYAKDWLSCRTCDEKQEAKERRKRKRLKTPGGWPKLPAEPFPEYQEFEVAFNESLPVANHLEASAPDDDCDDAEEDTSPYLSPGNTGAVGELLVSIDLMRRGYFVYRAIGPNSPFDLFAYRDGVGIKLEVRMGTPRSGFPSVSWTRKDSDRCDHYAIWRKDRPEIFYYPSLPTIEPTEASNA